MTHTLHTTLRPFTRTPKRKRSAHAIEHTLTPRVAMIQDGARLHYALPAALQHAGQLHAMYTDWYNRRWRDALLCRAVGMLKPSVGLAMAARSCPGLDPDRIRSQTMASLRHRMARGRFDDDAAYYQWASRQNAAWLTDRGIGDANTVMGFVRHLDPQWLAIAHRAGLVTVADQIIAPAAIEKQQLHAQMQRWPRWQSIDLSSYDRIDAVERATWQSLEHITCGSRFVRDSLVQQGLDADHITVLPYPIDTSRYRVPDRASRPGPVTVGCVGSVSLRKGAPAFFEVARRLGTKRTRFVMVGPVAIDRDVATRHCGDVQLVGRVDRRHIPAQLTQFDLLLLPSVCEGNAGAVTEAMAMGLPVVTTPGAGSIVRDGVGGYICQHDDIDAMTARVSDLVADENLRLAMSADARRRAEQFSLERYSETLAALLTRLLNT